MCIRDSSTSAHCIGSAWEQIRLGNQDVVIAGGAEDEHWTMSGLFDAMGALSSSYNENPENASRPFDEKRDGFVISGGGGIVIVEEPLPIVNVSEENAPPKEDFKNGLNVVGVIASTSPVPLVFLPSILCVAICCILANVTCASAM